MRRLALILTVAGAVLAPATPASAHGGDAPEATAYRTMVTGITPPVRGISVRTVEAGARLELTNDSGRPVEVLGYSGEPYLEVRPDGAYENVHSPATYLNVTLAGDGPVPATADPAAPPSWRRVSGSSTVRWHDRRTRWLEPAPPPGRIRDWAVPLRDQTRTFEIRGTLDHVPPPAVAWWWAGVVLLAVAVAVLALALRWRRAVRAVALIAGMITLGYAVLRALDGMPLSPVLIVVGLAAVAAYRPFLMGLAGVLLAVFAGLLNAGVFRAAVVPAAGPAWLSRLAVLVAIGAGAGMVAAAALQLRTPQSSILELWLAQISPRAAKGQPQLQDRGMGASRTIVRGMTDTARLAPGDPAPDFTLPTDTGDSLALKDLRGRKVVLYAYPAAMTPGCTTQACDFRDSLASLQAAGYEVVGISPDKPAKLAQFREHDAITFPLVSDQDKSVLTAYGAWGEKQLYGKTTTGVIRSTFVIDENGTIERALYNVKATGHVAKLRKDLGID